MSISEKILEYMNQQPKGLLVSTEQIADATAQNILFVQASCRALRDEKALVFCSQTVEGESPSTGVITGGQMSETIQWYRLPDGRGGARASAGRKPSERKLVKHTVYLFADQLPIDSKKLRDYIDILSL